MAMAAAFGSTVVWEWMNDIGEWTPYEADVSNFIEENYASQSNGVRLADIDKNLSTLAVDLVRMTQVSQNGIERPIRRELHDGDSAVAHGATWQWGGDTSRQRNVRYTWHLYSMEVANMLEFAYSRNRYSVVDLDVHPINQPYVVDLSQMKQINKTSGFARPVQRLLTGAGYRTLGSSQTSSNSQSWQQYLGSFFTQGSAGSSGSSGFGTTGNSGSSGFGTASNSGSSGFGTASNSGSSAFGTASNSGSSAFGTASNYGSSGFGNASNTGSFRHGSLGSSGSFGFGGTPQSVPMVASVHGHSNMASSMADAPQSSMGLRSSSGFNFSSPSYPPASQTTFGFSGGSSSGNSLAPSAAASSSMQPPPSGARPKRVRALRRNLTPGFSSDTASSAFAQSAPTSNWSFDVNGPTSSGAQGTSASSFTSWRDPSSQAASGSSGHGVHYQPPAPSAPAGNGTGSSRSSRSGNILASVSDLISGLSGMVVNTYRYVVTGGNLNQNASSSSVVPAAVPPTITSNAAKPGARSIGNNFVNAKRQKVSGNQTNSVPQDDLSHVQSLTAKDVLTNYMKEVKNPPAKEDCCICCDSLREASGYGQGNSYTVVQLIKCSHMFHVDCLSAMYDSSNKNGSIQCPSCKAIYGTKYGNCPNGNMEYRVIPDELSGYKGSSTIEIKYVIYSGMQGEMHPNPGRPYKVRGFPRFGYLPNNHEGQKVLSLLMAAWRRRLTFTIGTSVTTGEPDVVVWNEIHHKTEMTDASGHGYPDPNYLSNVMSELAAHGVTDDSQ